MGAGYAGAADQRRSARRRCAAGGGDLAGRCGSAGGGVQFDYQADDREAEQIRWYLEDYAEFPADPGAGDGAEAEARLAQAGAELFRGVFAGPDAAGIWERARARLGEVRVEVDTDPAEAPGLPWELLRDPGPDTALALGRARLSAPICGRPGIRSAGGGRGPAAGAAGDLPAGRPRTMCRSGRWPPGWSAAARTRWRAWTWMCCARPRSPGCRRCCTRPQMRGGPITWCISTATAPTSTWPTWPMTRRRRRRDRPATAAVAGSAVSPLPVRGLGGGAGAAGPARVPAVRGPRRRGNQQLVDGPTLGRLLAATGVPVLVLNACRSAYTEAPAQPGEQPDAGSRA